MKFHTDIPELENYDLVVCGGGPSGIPAAVAARRARVPRLGPKPVESCYGAVVEENCLKRDLGPEQC